MSCPPARRTASAPSRHRDPLESRLGMGDSRDDEVAALRGEVARRQAELLSSRALYQATIESLPFDFWARDREGYCVSQNRATREHWGNLLDRRPEDMELPADVIETWLANNRRALAGEIVRGDVDYMLGGELRHIQNVLAPIRQGDAIVGTLGVNIDLTDLRRAEADRRRLERRLLETQRLETLGLLAGGVAHDINNIVMIVLGLASLARRHADPGAALDRDLATIENASRRAGEICRQLLVFSGRGQLEREPDDLAALVGAPLALEQPRTRRASDDRCARRGAHDRAAHRPQQHAERRADTFDAVDHQRALMAAH